MVLLNCISVKTFLFPVHHLSLQCSLNIVLCLLLEINVCELVEANSEIHLQYLQNTTVKE